MLKIAENMVFELTAHLVPIKENQLSNVPFFIGFFHSPQLEKQIFPESKM
jgi:hypothetical protein